MLDVVASRRRGLHLVLALSNPPLFTITTDRITLTWSRRNAANRRALWTPRPGRLRVICQRPFVVDRHPPPEFDLSDDTGTGPRMDEETDYQVYARPQSGGNVSIRHEDPTLEARLRTEVDGACHGTVNFRSNVGLSRFQVVVDGLLHLTFEVEVFPSKLDYDTDYNMLLADVQDIATGLALDYLRSTHRFGRAAPGTAAQLEWVILLQHVFDDLQKSLRHIAAHPRHGIAREPKLVRSARVRRPDASVRAAVLREAGAGPLTQVDKEVRVRERLWTRSAIQTLDTPEHRWLANQLRLIRRRLTDLIRVLEAAEHESERSRAQATTLRAVDASTAVLERLEPIAAAGGDPPPGFSSQQLLAAPGYREAYQACMILRSGLRLEGDAVRLSTRELHELYEYWCYLTVVRLLNGYLDAPLDTADLFSLSATGLRLKLAHGNVSRVRFRGDRHQITVRYNPAFQSSSAVLVPQRPDVMVTLEQGGWPRMHLVLDAKYRLDGSAEYAQRYKGVGPPEDALNVLHRYRDAIVEQDADIGAAKTVVQAVAAFPSRDTETRKHRDTRHWQSLQRIGIGAVPLLPEGVEYLDEWLRTALKNGGWSMADNVIPHVGDRRLGALRVAAATRVLVAPVARDAWQHAVNNQQFTHEGQRDDGALDARYVALLSRPGGRGGGIEVAYAPVTHASVSAPVGVARSQENTYVANLSLGPVTHRDLIGDLAMAVPTVTSCLAAERATTVAELSLMREEEWRMRDRLDQGRMLRAIDSRWRTPDGRESGPWLRTAAEDRVRYAAADGYETLLSSGDSEHHATMEQALQLLESRAHQG